MRFWNKVSYKVFRSEKKKKDSDEWNGISIGKPAGKEWYFIFLAGLDIKLNDPQQQGQWKDIQYADNAIKQY